MYRDIAPVSAAAWNEIDDSARDVLLTNLTARRTVKVDGPKGADHTAVDEGRLEEYKKAGEVDFATYQVKPLVESRIEFELPRMELDNIDRGAKDPDLEALENAVKAMALFEEDVIYNGNKDAGIVGLTEMAKGEPITLGKKASGILGALAKGVLQLQKAYAEKPYDLICSETVYEAIVSAESAVPMLKEVERLIGGSIFVSRVLDGALLIPHDHDDLELTIGNDFEIGYQAHDINRVRFYVKESFTFRALDDAIIVRFK